MLDATPVSEFDPRKHIDYDAGADPDVLGQECVSCHKLYTFKSGMYDRDSSMKYGFEVQCTDCKKAPRMSMAEHYARLEQENYNSEFTRRQRHEDQDEFRKDRTGRSMDCSVFLQKLLHVCPNLHVQSGAIIGDLAVYVTSGIARPEWKGQTYKYMGFISLGNLPENSTYEFEETRNVVQREKVRGWRGMLVRFVENNILTEAQCNQEFGPPSGGANSLWYKRLYRKRNANNLN